MPSKPETTDPDRTATLQLVIALARSYQAIDQGVRPQLAEQGLSTTEFAVLEVLYHKGALPLGEIRDRILVTGASTTYVVNKLEERGLMRRRTSAEDQRIVFGELTPKGRALMDQVFPAHVESLRKLMSTLWVEPSENFSVADAVWLPSVPAPMNAMCVASEGSETGTVCPSPFALSGWPAATAGRTKCSWLFGTLSTLPCGAPAACNACREYE